MKRIFSVCVFLLMLGVAAAQQSTKNLPDTTNSVASNTIEETKAKAEILVGSKFVGVLQINPTQHRPHIISVDLGKVRKGQIVIRRGSGTDGVTINDLLEFFYGSTSTYFSGVIKAKQADAQQKLAEVEYMRQLRVQENDNLRAMEVATGMPKGSLGGE
jgi:hypothetical protein